MKQDPIQRSSSVDDRRTPRNTAYAPLLVLALLCSAPGCVRATPVGGEAGTPAPEPSDAAKVAEASDAAKVAEAPGAANAPELPKSVASELPPEGWTRLELSTLVPWMTGTIDLPPGITAKVTERQEIDADGLDAEGRGIQIGDRVGGVELETVPIVPTRFSSSSAMAKFHGQFEHVSTHDFGPDHWAVVHRWRPGECMLHGWSAAAGLSCDVFKAPCDQIEQWVQVCASLRAGPTPNHSPTTGKTAFPQLDAEAAEVAMTVARAVARNDASLLLGAIGPKGVKLGNKTYTAASLEAALDGDSVAHVVAPSITARGESPEELYWNAHSSKQGEATVWFTSGYGEQPYFTVKKTEGRWSVVRFGVDDLGEP